MLAGVLEAFNRFYYETEVWENKTFFLGIPVKKAPTDLWLYQELIARVRPQVIIETGTYRGGSAVWMLGVQLLAMIKDPLIITIDTEFCGPLEEARIIQLTGSSTEIVVQEAVNKLVSGKGPVMVVLDSDHNCDHVLDEMEMYADLVNIGSYLIVEDTNVNGHPVRPEAGPGPMEAVKQFLLTEQGKKFEIDYNCHKFLLTFNPGGYLLRTQA